jgi:hypothetical protein
MVVINHSGLKAPATIGTLTEAINKIMLTALKSLFVKKKPATKQFPCYSLTCPFTAPSEQEREQHYQTTHEPKS